MCQGFSHFSDILHHFVSAKLATSSIRVNFLGMWKCMYIVKLYFSNSGSLCNFRDIQKYEVDFLFSLGEIDYEKAFTLTSELVAIEVINRICVCLFEVRLTNGDPPARPGGGEWLPWQCEKMCAINYNFKIITFMKEVEGKMALSHLC